MPTHNRSFLFHGDRYSECFSTFKNKSMTILHDNSMKFVLLQIEIEEKKMNKKTKIHAYQAKFGLKKEMRYFF